ncbi:hypothetical protein [Paraburkholderia sp. J76]|uniref:hypothetical protein n=1 Tax=Paraburkholderia sp. J76 TaxID=2805439 RepID=UPI002ABDCB5F|nr:hypothetical protein [Paraburkholderia sp. J76]
MFSEFSDKGKEALGKAYFLTGLVPACVAVIGFLCVLLGPTVVIEKITELIGSESKTEITWTALSVLVVSFVLTVIREAVVSLFENVPGKPCVKLRDWLISRALRSRHRLKTQRERLEAEFTVVNWLKEKGAGPLYIPETVSAGQWEQVRRLNNWAFVCACIAADRLKDPLCVPQMSAKEVRIISSGFLALIAFHHANKDSSPAREEKEKWIDWVSIKGESADSTLAWMLDFKTGEIADAWLKLNRYPTVKWIRPTALGNRFSALQDYAEKRYRMETSVLWERVWWILPKEHRKEIGATRTILESLLTLSVVFIVLSTIAAAILATKLAGVDITRAHNDVSVLQVAITLAALIGCAISSYRLSLVPADSFVRKVESLIDIYRAALLHAVGMEPESVKEELDVLNELKHFWVDGVSRTNWRTIKAVAAAGAAQKKSE